LLLDFANAGSNSPANIAIIAITTSNSIRVKPLILYFIYFNLVFKCR